MKQSTIRSAFLFSVLGLGLLGCDESEGDGEPGGRVASDVVLVHGAWADGSCWNEVIERLQADGFTVRAVQLRQQTLADDAAIVRRAIAAIPRPVIVAGHSYGGMVMSEATTGAENVMGLVYVAAFAPAEGETLGALTAAHPTPTLMHLHVDEVGDTTIEPEAFVRYFASDLPAEQASALEAVQSPTAFAILTAAAGEPGWESIPTYYQISLQDEVIAPALQRFFADRMGAHTIELEASHVSMISKPGAIVDLIELAADGD